MSQSRHPMRVRVVGGGSLATLASAACVVLALAFPGQAQPTPTTPALAPETGATIWAMGGCSDCHGNLANGDGDPAYPPGPNLRRSRLEPDSLREAIACGRPSTAMPFNLAGAYTETACYGLPLGSPPIAGGGAGFTAEQIDVLVAFLVEQVIGVTRITRENCAVFFGGNPDAPGCLQY